MYKLARFIGMIILLITAIHVHAADCQNPKTQLEMNQCARQELEQLNKEINKVYTEYRSRLSKAQKQQIKEVQLAWIKYRDLACEYESSGVTGGSAHSMVMQLCLAEKTRIRLKEIQALANCQEGDLSCPSWK